MSNKRKYLNIPTTGELAEQFKEASGIISNLDGFQTLIEFMALKGYTAKISPEIENEISFDGILEGVCDFGVLEQYGYYCAGGDPMYYDEDRYERDYRKAIDKLDDTILKFEFKNIILQLKCSGYEYSILEDISVISNNYVVFPECKYYEFNPDNVNLIETYKINREIHFLCDGGMIEDIMEEVFELSPEFNKGSVVLFKDSEEDGFYKYLMNVLLDNLVDDHSFEMINIKDYNLKGIITCDYHKKLNCNLESISNQVNNFLNNEHKQEHFLKKEEYLDIYKSSNCDDGEDIIIIERSYSYDDIPF